MYDSLTTTTTSWLGAPPDAGGSPAAWGEYLGALRDKIQLSKASAISAYNTLKQVRENLGLPFFGGGGENPDLGAWSQDLEQQAVDILEMSKICVGAADDAIAGKRKLIWDDKVEDFAVEGFPSDKLRIQYDGSGTPVLVDGAGYPQHASGQVGFPPIVFGAIAVGAVVQAVGIYLIVDKALDTIQVVANQKTEKTVAEATKKHADLVAQGKATPAEAEALNNSIYKGATDLRKAATEPKAKQTADIADAVKTLAWVGLGIGVLYVVAQFVKGGGALAGARDNPSRAEWIKSLDEDEAALRRVQQDIKSLSRGGTSSSGPYHTLYSALSEERALRQVIANKKALVSRLRDNPDYTRFRSSYLPSHMRDVPPLTPSGTDLEIWTWEDERRSPRTGEMVKTYHGIAFAGKAGKPLWHHWFGTAASRLDMITRSIASRKAHLKYREERMGARKGFQHTLKVGDVLYTSYGYDQTNVSFYEVVETKGKSVVVCKIGGREVEARQNISYVVPAVGTCRGEKSLHRVGEGNSVKIDNHYAHKWDGKPVYETASGWGH